VLAIARPVAVGSVVTAADLDQARVASDPNLSPIPAAQQATVVGKIAAVPLVAGTLLTSSDLTATAIPARGQQLVGLLLKPGQLPARPLIAGERVLIVSTPGTQSTGGGSASVTSGSVLATVADIGGVGEDGSETVDVSVPATVGASLARQAATGNIAVIVVAAAGTP
jgi:hypothetical protein